MAEVRTGPKIDANLTAAIGFRIRVARRALGMRQGELAAGADISRQTVSNIETARKMIGIVPLMRICRALGVTPNDILGWSEEGGS